MVAKCSSYSCNGIIERVKVPKHFFSYVIFCTVTWCVSVVIQKTMHYIDSTLEQRRSFIIFLFLFIDAPLIDCALWFLMAIAIQIIAI